MSNQLDYEINKELGECYLFMGELDKAEEYYKKACNNNGKHPDPYLGLATIAMQRGNLEEAYTLYSKASDIKPDDKAYTGLALIEMETGKETEAFDHLNKALNINPENIVAVFGVLRISHCLGKLDKAVEHLKNYLALDPLKNEIRYALAGCLYIQGQTGQAEEELNRILENDPEHVQAKELLQQIQQG